MNFINFFYFTKKSNFKRGLTIKTDGFEKQSCKILDKRPRMRYYQSRTAKALRSDNRLRRLLF